MYTGTEVYFYPGHNVYVFVKNVSDFLPPQLRYAPEELCFRAGALYVRDGDSVIV